MSADSPRRSARSAGVVIRPQPVSDKTVMESVVDFFQDVVPQAYSGTQKNDDREKVQWVRFEDCDINDVKNNPDCCTNSGNVSPLLLVLGYTNGVQIWAIMASGEAQEVLSLRQGPVKTLRVLATPEHVYDGNDLYKYKRPLVAICDTTSAGQPYCAVKFVSLRTGDEVHNISFKNPVTSIKCNRRILVVAFSEKIAAFDACSLKQRFCIMCCYPAPGPDPNPIALASRWLAYSDKKLVPLHQSCGGMTGDGAQSYAATVISAAKTITKGLTMFGETVASSLTGKHPPTTKKEVPVLDNGKTPGIVTIIDIQNVGEGVVNVQEDTEGEGIIAHFPAHANEPLAAMEFDPSGMLLLTACRLGHNFHIFRIMVHPWSSSLGAVHHLFTLHRGDTTAKVQDISFTMDSRWVAISTLRGTTHVFPITPYGGAVNVRTHTSTRVVNRASRFHKSAGIDDLEPSRTTGRHSPVQLSGSPGSSSHADHYPALMHQNTMNNIISNPRLPPYPHPTTVHPVVQIRQSINIPGIGGSTSGCKKGKVTSPSVVDSVCLATCFASSRGWVVGSPSVARDKGERTLPVDSLYVISWSGNLVEYVLEPHPKSGLEKITHESPLEVTETARAQWTLIRNVSTPEVRPPLPNNNLLVLASDAVLSQQPSLTSLNSTVTRHDSKDSLSSDHSSKEDSDDQWLSQVEMITHAGPHRRLWMGPQFSFKTFQNTQATTILSSNSSALLSQSPETHASTMDIVSDDIDLQSLKIQPARSSPVAMPGTRNIQRHSSAGSDTTGTPSQYFIEAGSFEQSPSIGEVYGNWPDHSHPARGEVAEDELRETLADAMIESPTKEGGPASRGITCDVYPQGTSVDTLSSSSSSGSTSSASRTHSYDARSSPPHSIEHVLVFPTGSGSPDSS